MSFKKISLVLAATLAMSGAAQAAYTEAEYVAPNSAFTNLDLGEITVGTLSNLTGSLGFIESGSLVFGTMNIPVTFSTVSFTGGSIGTYTFTGPSFSIANLAAGTYEIFASGTAGSGVGGMVLAQYNLAPVPEPGELALMLSGLGLMGYVVRRRQNRAA